MKQIVCTVTDNRQQGFTMVSMLVISTVLFTALPFLAYATKAVMYDPNYDEASVQQFYQFLRDDLIMAKGYAVSKNKLILYTPDGKNISFTRYNQEVLRQVDNQGHDIYLRNIREIIFEELPYGVLVKITSSEGKKYEKALVFYSGS